MPNYNNNRTFSNGNIKNVSANDYINKIKAKSIFQVVSSNTTDKETNSNIPVKTAYNFCNDNYKKLRSVGGFDVNSYQLLLDLTKGRYYVANTGRYATIQSDKNTTVAININDCSNVSIKGDSNNSIPITRNLGILENNFLNNLTYNDISCGCADVFNTKNNKIEDMLINKTSNGTKNLAYWIDNEPLRGFRFPNTFSMLDQE